MFREQASGLAIYADQLRSRGAAAAKAASPSELLALTSIATAVLACVTILVWAASKGLNFGDEAYYVLTLSDPFSRIDVSDSGYFWYPLYRVLRGDIASLRLAGALIMAVSALLFAQALLRFIGPVTRMERLCTTLGLCTCLIWQYKDGIRVPSYNTLNLCALLIFFTGLMRATARPVGLSGNTLWQMIGPSLLCGLGLTVMGLAKQTSAAAAVVLGLCWIALLRPNRSGMLAIVTAVCGLSLFFVFVFGIYDSVSAFIEAKTLGLEELRSLDTSGDVHGIAGSFVKSVSAQHWKILEYAESAGGFVLLALAWGWLLTSRKQSRAKSAAAYAISVLFACMMVWWRTEDFRGPSDAFGDWRFGAWNFQILMLLAAAAVCRLCARVEKHDKREHQAVIAAALFAATPFVYSFGTNGAILFHAATASIFWAAAVVMLAGAGPVTTRTNYRNAAAFVCAATATGLVIGMAAAPYRDSPPLWENNELTVFGITKSRLGIDHATAGFVHELQQLAHVNGFQQGMAIVDFSAGASGVVLALGGSPIASTASLSYPGEESHARFAFEHTSATKIREAWVITDAVGSLAGVQRLFAERGIDFPARYEAIAHVRRADGAWDQVVWRPRQFISTDVRSQGFPLHRPALHYLIRRVPP